MYFFFVIFDKIRSIKINTAVRISPNINPDENMFIINDNKHITDCRQNKMNTVAKRS